MNNKIKSPMEMYTRTNINQKLINLGYVLDESSTDCNIYQERAKTLAQDKLLQGRNPDYLIYQKNTNNILAVIEAKRPGVELSKSINQALEYYAKPLNIPIIFVTNDAFVQAYSAKGLKPLKIDGAELQDFVDEKKLLEFIDKGFEIDSTPSGLNYTKEELLLLFKKANKLLRKAGLRDGYERFSVFADLLFLKLKDDLEDINETSNKTVQLDKRICWKTLISKKEEELILFLEDSVKPKLRAKYGDVFDKTLNISNESILKEILNIIDSIDFNKLDSDIKGDAFEFFLRNVTNGNKDLGEYYTPRHIIRTIINMIAPKFGQKMYDPFCGTGGFLLEGFRYLSKNSDMSNAEIRKTIKEKSLFGREITSTARIAKMNMILFGDGHSNIEQLDSLSKPVKEKFDIVVSNIPYSQTTDYGAFLPIPTETGDSAFVQHMWTATKDGGTMAVVIPETFLYETGVIKETRDLIINNSESIIIVSLPRGVFNPYTPTKTSVIIAKKKKSQPENCCQLKNCYFFVVRNDGFELGARRRPLGGKSDYSKLLTYFPERITDVPDSLHITGDKILNNSVHSLLPFSYMEHLPVVTGELDDIGRHSTESHEKYNEDKYEEDDECAVLQVSKKGIFLEEIYSSKEMSELSQKYKKVKAGDVVYNPHRINIGSVGVVPDIHNNMFVSPIYVVFRTGKSLPPYYLVSLLKKKEYLTIINDYCLGGARSILTYEQLKKIKVQKASSETILKYINISKSIEKAYNNYLEALKLLN